MKKVKNYGRFFGLIKGMEGDPKEIKEQFVFTYTGQRTKSLREMTPAEYNQMCDDLQAEKNRNLSESDFTTQIKAKRSAVLKRIQQLGIDTTDFSKVDKFVLNPRISGKRFAQLTLEELTDLIPKLEAIAKKPKRSTRPDPDPVPEEIKYLLYFPNSMLN